MQSGRTTILVLGVATLVWTAVQVFTQVQDLAKQHPAAGTEAETAHSIAWIALCVGAAVDGFLGLAFIGLWAWAKHRPFPATLIALLLYLALQGLSFALDPAAYGMVFIRVIVVMCLIQAVISARKYEQLQRV